MNTNKLWDGTTNENPSNKLRANEMTTNKSWDGTANECRANEMTVNKPLDGTANKLASNKLQANEMTLTNLYMVQPLKSPVTNTETMKWPLTNL